MIPTNNGVITKNTFAIFLISTNKNIRIANFVIGNNNPVFIIAEAGINHNGSFKIAKKMVDVATKAGVHCIKFQTHITEKEMIRSNITPGNISKKTLWSIIKNCELTESEEEKIQQYCRNKKLLFLSTPFSKDAVDRLEKINIPAYKIGSGELTNIPFLYHIAKTKKPVILSTGTSTINEIREAVKVFKKYNASLALLQTTSIYPTDYKDVKLGAIEKLQKLFKLPIGISESLDGRKRDGPVRQYRHRLQRVVGVDVPQSALHRTSVG